MDYNITWRKKDKGWQCIISYKDNFGKWKQKSKQGFKTQKEGKEWISATVKQLEKSTKTNININDGEKTFKEVTEMYLEHIVLYREYETVSGYKVCFSKFKELNDMKIKDIKKCDIQKVMDSLIKENLKQSTLKVYLRRINVFFKYIKNDLNLINILPTEHIEIPKAKSKSVKKALTKKELENLLNNLKDYKYYIVAFIAANTGMRIGEILGLTWNDLDEINMTIEVNKQWKPLSSGTYGFGTLKSKNSNRIIPVSPKTLNELKKYKKNSPTDINNRIAPFNRCTIINSINLRLRNLMGISIHELRHTYATLLISSGIDFKTAAKILGHDVEQTMRTYSHVTDDMMKKASDTISKIF